MTAKQGWFNAPKSQKNILLAISWLIILTVAFWLKTILLPFILAALIAYIIDPVVEKIIELQAKLKTKKFTLPRPVVVLLIYLVVIAVFTLFFALFLPEIYSEIIKLAKFLAVETQKLNKTYIDDLAINLEGFFRRNNIPVHMLNTAALPADSPSDNILKVNLLQLTKDLLGEISSYFTTQSADILGQVQTVITSLVKFIFQFFLVLMISAFILVDTQRIKNFLFRLVSTEDKAKFDALLGRIDTGLSGVVRGQLIICCVNGVLTLLGLWLIGVKFAFILATIAGVMSFVPIFGCKLSTIPIFIVALTTSPNTAFMALLWIVAIHALEANLLNPKILGSSAKIHPVLIVLALLAGEHYYGIAGAVLAVPMASIALTIFHSLLNYAQKFDEPVAK